MAVRRWKIGLAVSGGADSTALALLLAACRKACGFDAVVLHVDHGLRADSAADACFVRALARRLGLPFHGTRVRVSRRPGESLEMAARRVRLDFFARRMKDLKLDAIATGHHADDVAETFLLRLARGSGPEGLAGLKRISRLTVETAEGALPLVFIRPLLDLRDAALKDFLRRRGETWREDATNADTDIPRNRVRHIVLPWLRENFDPRITEHLCKSAAILRGDLTRSDVPSLRPAAPPLPQPAEPSAAWRLTIAAAKGFVRAPQAFGVYPAEAFLSRAALAGRTLEVRTWRAGDRIAPVGLAGHSRKLQDVFVTAKVPAQLRSSLPILTDAQTGEILWVPGYRVAETAAVPSTEAASWRFRIER